MFLQRKESLLSLSRNLCRCSPLRVLTEKACAFVYNVIQECKKYLKLSTFCKKGFEHFEDSKVSTYAALSSMSLIFLPLSLFTLESPFTLLRPHFYPPSSGTFVSIWGFEREDREVIHSLSCWNLNSLASQRHRFEKAYYFAWKARTKKGGISLLPPPLSVLSFLLLLLFSFRT